MRKKKRTVPIPIWVKAAIDRWTSAANVTTGRIFRAISRHGTVWAKGSQRMSSGTWFGGVPNGCNWIILLRMTFAEPAPSSVT
jgi:hypothetical protein